MIIDYSDGSEKGAGVIGRAVETINTVIGTIASEAINTVILTTATTAVLILGIPANAKMVKASEEKMCSTKSLDIEIICKGNIAYIIYKGYRKGGISVKYNPNGDIQKCECRENDYKKSILTEIENKYLPTHLKPKTDIVYLDDGQNQ